MMRSLELIRNPEPDDFEVRRADVVAAAQRWLDASTVEGYENGDLEEAEDALERAVLRYRAAVKARGRRLEGLAS